MEVSVREPAVANAFYPGDGKELLSMIKNFLTQAKKIKLSGELKGLVVPHAGYTYSGLVAAAGYVLVEDAKPNKIILLGPSHYASFNGACEAGFEYWQTSLGKVKTGSIVNKANSNLLQILPQAHEQEHCLEVQMPFLQVVLKNFEAFPLLYSRASPEELGRILLPVIDKKTVFIASSDLSHYLPYEEAKRVDKIANETIPALDIPSFNALGKACGKTAILTLMHVAKAKGWKGAFVDYKNSGDTAGSKEQVVGYGCYAFYEKR